MLQYDNEKVNCLYKKLRLIAEKENHEISAGNIDKLEEYKCIKDKVIKLIDKMKNNGLTSLNDRAERVERYKLIQDILVMNEKNRNALISLQNDVMSEISSLQRGKKAHKAYSSQSYVHRA